jgi:hypothetical protein
MGAREFIDTFSDDLITIREARAAAYTHPLRGDYAFAESLLDASFCRIFAVFAVSGIEAMLESWRERDEFKILEGYFAERASDSDRAASLCEAFSGAGIQPDKEIVRDYLAIKHLRNAIIRGRWKECERDWVDARGFPTDTRKLAERHLDRIEHVHQNIMLCIALTGLADPNAPRPAGPVRLDEAITRRREDSGILRIRDIARIIWNNLERIDARIHRDIEQAATCKEYDWTEGRSQVELDALGHHERKRLFYLAARRAGEQDHEPLAQHRDLGREALEFWREYWRRSVAPNIPSARSALDVFMHPEFNPETPVWVLVSNAQEDDEALRFVDRAMPRGGSLTAEQVVRALRAGKAAYEIIPNITPVALFTVGLPIVDPRNMPAYLREAERAIDLFRLNRAWYEYAERRRRFADDDNLGFYVRMCREFAQRPQGGKGDSVI